jgi:hypothetical protein
MSLISRTMNHCRACLLLIVTVACLACDQDVAGPIATQQGDDPSQPPLEINFKHAEHLFRGTGEKSCEVPEGRQQVYDPKTGVFHIHFKPRNFECSAFEVTKVAERFAKPLVFRLTGVPRGYGCVGRSLALSVADKSYALEENALAPGPFDKTLFRVQRKEKVVTIEFTQKGQALLKPGAQISFTIDTGW